LAKAGYPVKEVSQEKEETTEDRRQKREDDRDNGRNPLTKRWSVSERIERFRDLIVYKKAFELQQEIAVRRPAMA